MSVPVSDKKIPVLLYWVLVLVLVLGQLVLVLVGLLAC